MNLSLKLSIHAWKLSKCIDLYTWRYIMQPIIIVYNAADNYNINQKTFLRMNKKQLFL